MTLIQERDRANFRHVTDVLAHPELHNGTGRHFNAQVGESSCDRRGLRDGLVGGGSGHMDEMIRVVSENDCVKWMGMG